MQMKKRHKSTLRLTVTSSAIAILQNKKKEETNLVHSTGKFIAFKKKKKEKKCYTTGI